MTGGGKITNGASGETERTKGTLGVGCETVKRRCSERFLELSSYSSVVGALAGGGSTLAIGNLRARRTADTRATNLRLIDRTADGLTSLHAGFATDVFARGRLLVDIAVGGVADGLTLALGRVVLVTRLTIGYTFAGGTVFDLTLGTANGSVTSPARGTGRTTDAVRGVGGTRESRSTLRTATLTADSTTALSIFVSLTTRTAATVGRNLLRVTSGGATLTIGGT